MPISVEYFDRHQGGERAILVSVNVQLLEDLDAEELRLLAQSAGADGRAGHACAD